MEHTVEALDKSRPSVVIAGTCALHQNDESLLIALRRPMTGRDEQDSGFTRAWAGNVHRGS